VGSFLNVCIHRLPLGESIVSPPSHCPHCRYSIPWYLNIPIVTWLSLRGKCRNCGAPIAARYLLVELLTGLLFLGCWVAFGRLSPALAPVYALLLAGMVVATFIDFEHFIIPDEITYGGLAVGLLCAGLLPALHGETTVWGAVKLSLLGTAVGAGLVYFILRVGKLLFGRHKLLLPPQTRVIFTETSVLLPEHEIPYEEVFYRKSDAITFHASTIELVDRCYWNVAVRLGPGRLQIGKDCLDPETVPHLEAVCDGLVLPREAMGLGDVKFMAAIGAFLGWQAVIFSLVVSSFIGAAVGIGLVLLKKRAISARLPYGPYIALGAALWIFAGPALVHWYERLITAPFGR
jgi:leader peptidase (prepilin peptidase) / N-methyltransferase